MPGTLTGSRIPAFIPAIPDPITATCLFGQFRALSENHLLSLLEVFLSHL